MTQYRSHFWVTAGVLFLALAVWIGNEGNRAGSAQTQELEKTLDIERYPDEPVQLVSLSIGVQSSWRNYGFLFQSEAASPLRKWVEHFGYELQ